MNLMQTDSAIVSAITPCRFRLRVLGAMMEALASTPDKEKINWEFFGHLDSYAGREESLPDGIEPGYDLWPPAIAALDYIVREISPSETILDFACGIGNLLVYLDYNGCNAYGFDTWVQLPRSAAVHFLSHFGLENRLLDLSTDFDTLVFTGGHWQWFTQEQQRLLLPALRTILVDSNYSPEKIPGFEKVAEYEGLLNVFKRT